MKIESDSSPPNRLNSQHKTTYFRKKETMNKNKISLVLIAIFLYVTANSQINKGYWLVGGNGSFHSNQTESELGISKSSNINISPNIGYFIVDKFAIGLMGDITFPNNSGSTFPSYNFGLFLRKYFLSTEKTFNFFGGGSYLVSINPGNSNNYGSYNATVGGVAFLNTSVAFEGIFNYGYSNTKYFVDNRMEFKIGFQIHLVRRNNN